MKVKYLKNHFQHNAGDVTEELTAAGANYLIRVGVVEKIEEEEPGQEKEEVKPKKEKKETKGIPTAKKK